MIIALDYDGTYTKDPAMWRKVIAIATEAGHRVVCVTSRWKEEAIEMPCEVIYTGRLAKARVAADAGIDVDIWIDDNPFFIMAGAE